ncbi:hypothetical protein NQ318_011106 [Aromia moschata]|uniref:UBC core domain-containing protein n=1 Tax=Aromia moschata TaxID=1265417 RepID=A0AAV8YTQ4_9CUCU|nr:hypothetical protein NQ318_011106 [Aromia moschata]
MYAAVKATKSENNENFQRQGSLRRVIPSDINKDNVFDHQNTELNKVYRIYRQEYVILAEYKMIQSEDIQGVYVIPSKESSLIWFGVIFVRNGPYEDGVFRFNILLDENFPDGEHPKVVFQSEVFHPVIDLVTNKLSLSSAFPKWHKSDQHLWQVLKYIQWIFDNMNASLAHAVNKEAEKMYRNDLNAFTAKAQELVKLSKEHLYDQPQTEDKHYIMFEPYAPEIHDKVRTSMVTFHEEQFNKVGHSWVLPGSYKSLARPPTPPSENES